MARVAAERGWHWDIELVTSPDPVLSAADEIIATSDSVVLDRCRRWFNLVRSAVTLALPQAAVLSLVPRGR